MRQDVTEEQELQAAVGCQVQAYLACGAIAVQVHFTGKGYQVVAATAKGELHRANLEIKTKTQIVHAPADAIPAQRRTSRPHRGEDGRDAGVKRHI